MRDIENVYSDIGGVASQTVLRYFIIGWQTDDAQQCVAAARVRHRLIASASTWDAVVDTPGLVVLIGAKLRRGEYVVPLQPTMGAAVGTLFRTNECTAEDVSESITSFSTRDTQRVLDSFGRSLVTTFWGSYVLAFRHPHSGDICILRGPLSPIRCLLTQFMGVTLAFASMRDYEELNLLPLTINWDCIEAHVSYADYLGHETGLAEVAALDGGECWSNHGGICHREAYWDPRQIALQRQIDDFDTATQVLSERVQYSVNCWASLHESILHTLSGGLDSSIVLSCLARAPSRPRIIAVNHYSAAVGDERHYARAIADKCGVELVERERDPRVDLRMFTRCDHEERPLLHLTACDAEPFNSRLAERRGVTAKFDGEFGDAVFGHSLWIESVLDYTWRHGWRPGLMRVVVDYAQHRRQSIWRTLVLALKRRVSARREPYWSSYGRTMAKEGRKRLEQHFVSADALRHYEMSHARFVHPWLTGTKAVPPGLFNLFGAMVLINSAGGYAPFGSAQDAVSISPLASQPVVEASLRIASYLHIRNGQNRAVARSGFADRLPPLVLHRGRGKGRPSLWLREVVAHNAPFLREYLLEGILVQRGILDRRKIEATLAADIQVQTATSNDVIPTLFIESWARRWAGSRLA